MANRIFIAIGLVAILILGAAFVVPWFVDWNAYKARMEQMASAALGADVVIAGDVGFVLLPQPRLHIEDVWIGPGEEPIGAARMIEADFALMDFLRDRFTVTQLRVIEPEIHLVVGADGRVQTPIVLAETETASNVSIAHARFQDGAVALTDLRSGERWRAERFSGDMQMGAVRGPFIVQGQAIHQGTTYGVRLSTSAMNAQGHMQVSAGLRPANGSFSASVEGLLQTGSAPRFEGQTSYRQFAPRDAETVTGDLVLTSPVIADADAVRLSEVVLLPDENHASARFTGEARVTLGADPAFDAAISGGVVTLVPNVLAEEGPQPFGLVRLLREMPQPIIPPLPGRVSLTVNELGLRGLALRDVRLGAQTDGTVWAIDNFEARLAGDTTLALSGTLGRAAGWPAFEGRLALASSRLDALALAWRRPEGGNPLFGMSGALEGDVQLVNDRLRLSDGVFSLADTTHEVAGEMRFGDAPALNVSARLSSLSTAQSTALLALLPPIAPDGVFGHSFPAGRLDLGVEAATFQGQRLSDLSLSAGWSADGMNVESIAVGSYGGIGLEGAGRVSGTLERPIISGQGVFDIAVNASALNPILGGANAGNPLRQAALGSLPARLEIRLDPPGRDGVQSAAIEGVAGAIDIVADLEMAGGLAGWGRERFGLSIEAAADSGAVLLDQLGFAPLIPGEDGAIASARLSGNPQGNVDTEFSIEGGGERLDFAGTLMLSDPGVIRGQGQASFLFDDTSALAELAGAQGIWFPALEGQAEIGFVGGQSVSVSNISAFVGDREMSGELTYAAQRQSALVSGALAFDALDVQTLAAMLGGPASVLGARPTAWPDGPLDPGQAPRATRGRISITAPILMSGESRLIEALAFDYVWGSEDTGLRGLFGEFGRGTVQLDATLCCTSTLIERNLTGRVTLNGVSLDAILPEQPAAVLDGRLTLGAQFQGSGESYREIFGALNGEGSFSVENLRIDGLSPSAFEAAAGIENLIEFEPEALEDLVEAALDDGAFLGREAGGLVSLIGGTGRISNIAIEGNGARLVGGTSLDLETGTLGGAWTLALVRSLAGNGLITETTGRIGVNLAGTIFAPQRRLDIGSMVDAIQMRAFEIELDELEALRAQQEARQRAAAEEQARLMEEETRRQAEQLLSQQREEAERLQNEAELERLRQIEELLEAPAPPQAPAPFDPGPSPSFTVLPPGTLELEPL